MTQAPLRVFYSWQSDRPNGVCRGFIQDALDRAAKADGLAETIIDRDTQGVPGTPDIVDVILEKIDKCDVFVADITLVTPQDATRASPNPNVLFELGYAVRSIGWGRILLVMNEAFGGFEKLPFDLGRTRRKPITFTLQQGQEKKDVREGLAKTLAEALLTVAKNASARAPAGLTPPAVSADVPARLKASLFDPSKQIELRELLTEVVDPACVKFSSETFSPNARFEVSDFPNRLAVYEEASREVVRVAALLGHWSQEDRHHKELARILRRLSATVEEQRAGTTILLELRWIPFLHVMYAAGIGAVSAENYASLSALFGARLPRLHEKEWSALDAFGATVSEFGAHEYFKAHPQFKDKRTPLSEYFYTILREPLEAVLKLGVDYDRLFDRFEILLALVHTEAHSSWPPIGRYGWKLYRRSAQNTEWGSLEAEAKAKGDAWAPLRAGLFGGSAKRFLEAQNGLWEKFLSKLNWY